jgi:hypothetical protein
MSRNMRISRMNRPHPNQLPAAVAIALLLAATVCGCSGPQTAMSNPFMSPDRVPPPSTRMVAPGTAQPYYPGDPLPPVQSAAPPTTAVDSFVNAESYDDDYSTTNTLAASGESPVGIPGDNDELRFALPAPPVLAEASPQPPIQQPAPAPAPTLAAAQAPAYASDPAFTPAVYNEADPYEISAPAGPVATDNGPWRSPQIAQASFTQTTPSYSPSYSPQPTLAPTAAAHPMAVQPIPTQPAVANALQPVYWIGPPQPTLSLPPPPSALPIAYAQPQLIPQSTMPVELHAVPSPPMNVATSAAPRIRFTDPEAPVVQQVAVQDCVTPNYTVPCCPEPTHAVPTYAASQAGYYVAAPSGVVETVPITELPPGGYYEPADAPRLAAQPSIDTTFSPDGFRPRGSTW